MEQMNQDRDYQQQRIKIEEQRLDIEKKALELRSRQAKEAKTTENLIVWTNFISRNPAFADVNSKQRKYGDYLFDKEYTYKMESGELTYIQALNAVAAETYKVFGGSPVSPPEIPVLLSPVAEEAPVPVPPVGPPIASVNP